ncbi:Cell morphogenesis N-terminal family protein [Aspergillus niger]|nr:Cell morphogenesis N-terminal family protein [Aspergillus niger]
MATCQPSTETLSGTEFYVRTLQLYKILRKILSEVYEPWEDERAPDQSERPKSENELAQTLLSLDEELLAFESNLPVALQWRDAQQPADVAGPFRRESSLLRGRFLHLRILLLRPTLVKFCRNGFPPRQAGGYPRYQQVLSKSRISVDFSISCSTSCVETAIELSHLMNDISTTELASVWWYNVFYAFTAGVVLILAQASPAMTSKFSQPVLENAWKSCCDCLENMNPYSNTARNCATNLRKTLSQVLDGQGQESRVLANKPVPQSTGQYLGRDTSLPRAPNYLSTLAGSEVGDDSTQGALDTQFSEALDSLWSGDDVNSSLMEMLWDDLWLTAPSFF